MKPIKIVIPLRPITKKNHSRIVTAREKRDPLLSELKGVRIDSSTAKDLFAKCSRTKKPRSFIIPSEAYEQYEANAGWYISHRGEEIDTPLTVKCLFYMPTHGRVDLSNLLEAIDDILTHYKVIKDDNSKIIVSHDGSRVLYDKENPRTEVYISDYTDKKEGCDLCLSRDVPCTNCEKIGFCDEKCYKTWVFEAVKNKKGYCPECGRPLFDSE